LARNTSGRVPAAGVVRLAFERLVALTDDLLVADLGQPLDGHHEQGGALRGEYLGQHSVVDRVAELVGMGRPRIHPGAVAEQTGGAVEATWRVGWCACQAGLHPRWMAAVGWWRSRTVRTNTRVPPSHPPGGFLSPITLNQRGLRGRHRRVFRISHAVLGATL